MSKEIVRRSTFVMLSMHGITRNKPVSVRAVAIIVNNIQGGENNLFIHVLQPSHIHWLSLECLGCSKE